MPSELSLGKVNEEAGTLTYPTEAGPESYTEQMKARLGGEKGEPRGSRGLFPTLL